MDKYYIMENINKINPDIELDFTDELYRQEDFADSVFVEELDADSIPAELMEEFQDSALGHFKDMLPGAFDNLIRKD